MSFVVILGLTAAIASVTVDCAAVCPLPDPPVKEDVCSGKCVGDDMYCQPSDDTSAFTCVCQLGYGYDAASGTCEDVDECAEETDDCDEDFRAMCKNTVGSFTCQCKTPYFEGDGRLCNRVDDEKCERTCPANKYCLRTTLRTVFGNFDADMCICQTGYKVSDSGCVDINECDNRICDPNNAACVNTSPGYKCQCKPGYKGNGIYCQDVNECLANTRVCDVHADCFNTAGSYRCECSYGYTGDGVSCTSLCPDECDIFMAQNATHIPDVNECTAQAQSPCPTDAVCVNTIGSYYCRCELGYEWDDTTSSCVDIDECARGIAGCAEPWMADCTNTAGGYNCACKALFDGDGHYCAMVGKQDCSIQCRPADQFCYDITIGPMQSEMCLCQFGLKATVGGCEDIAECSDNPSPCDPNAVCSELVPGYMCLCKTGYEGDGFSCRDIDECISATTNTCGENTDCINTAGSYKCECQHGYTGDGVNCEPICPGPTKLASGVTIPA
ncbi:hypothetical protein LSAT2_009860 [Lamellibrachia satsuma]|nr:hypothetical protein LSAT2_009860 [Lamellibrachia satsuma]